MLSLEESNRLLHRSEIERVVDVPGKTVMKGGGGRVVPYSVPIEPALGVPARVERVGNRFDLPDHDVVRREGIEPFVKPPEIDRFRREKIGHLTQRVNPRVCAAGAVDPDLEPEKFFQGLLQNRLNGLAIGLDLPAVIVGPVVLDSELDIHGAKNDGPRGSENEAADAGARSLNFSTGPSAAAEGALPEARQDFGISFLGSMNGFRTTVADLSPTPGTAIVS